MENVLETRVINLEEMTDNLAQSLHLTTGVLSQLVQGITPLVTEKVKNEVGIQFKDEFKTQADDMKSNIISTITEDIDDKVRTAVNDRGLNRGEMNKLTSARNLRFRQLLGDSKSDKYILLISFYQGAMVKGYRNKFNCGAYGDIEATRFSEAIEYINNFDVTLSYYDWSIEKLHEQYRDGEIENRKKFNAYERFFGIRVD